LPLSLDPAAPRPYGSGTAAGGVSLGADGNTGNNNSTNHVGLERLWDGLAAYGVLAYALPDWREWHELVVNEEKPWSGGIDLLLPMHQ
jgi:hypothetical protein